MISAQKTIQLMPIQLMPSIRVHRYSATPSFSTPFPAHDSQKAVCILPNPELPKEPSPISGHSAKTPQTATYDNVHLARAFAPNKFPSPAPYAHRITKGPSPISEHPVR